MSAGTPDKRDAILKTALHLFVKQRFYGPPSSRISKERTNKSSLTRLRTCSGTGSL